MRLNLLLRMVLGFLLFSIVTTAAAGPYPRSYLFERTKQAFRAFRVGGNFWKAVEENKISKVKWLLRFHPELANEPLYNGKQPLLIATTPEMTEILCAAGADVNFIPSRFYGVIFDCISREDYPMMRVLLKHDLDLSITGGRNGLTPLDEAVRLNSMKLVKFFVEGGAEIEPGENGPVYKAAKYGSIEVLRYFISQSTKLNVDKLLALTMNACNGDSDSRPKYEPVAKLLIDNGADVNSKLTSGYDFKKTESLLVSAIRHGALDMAKLLMKSGADVNSVNSEGDTALLIASECDDTEIVWILINKGANLECENGFRQTPLFVAARKGNRNVAELLIQKGARLEPESRDCRPTPLCIAIANNHSPVATLLVNKGANVNPYVKGTDGGPLNRAASGGFVDLVYLLLEKGALIDAQTFRGSKTPLHEAAEENHIDVFELLVKAGADTTLLDSMKRTALDRLSLEDRKRMEAVIREQRFWPPKR